MAEPVRPGRHRSVFGATVEVLEVVWVEAMQTRLAVYVQEIDGRRFRRPIPQETNVNTIPTAWLADRSVWERLPAAPGALEAPPDAG